MADDIPVSDDPPVVGILETRNVSIDTSAFENLSYRFSAGALLRLREHPYIKIVLPDVIVREVRDHLAKAAEESVRLHKSFSDTSRILRNLGSKTFEGLFRKFTSNDVARELNSSFEKFILEAEVEVIPVSTASVEEVFDRYFASHPPFETGKKKSEFPDAFALDSLKNWAVAHDTKVYVISMDKGVQAYCNESTELICLSDVDKFLELAVRADAEVAERIKEVAEDQRETFVSRLVEAFNSIEFYIEDREGEVEEIRVKNTEILDFSVVELARNTAIIKSDVAISYEADVSYEDLENAPYDSETKSLIVMEWDSDTWERTFEGTCEFQVEFDPSDPESFSIETITINDGEMIGLEYDDGWPYK